MVSHENEWLKVLATGERMVELLPLEPEIKDTPTARARTIIGQIQFEEVGFRYQRTRGANRGKPKIRPSETMALVGPSGVGKTTLVGLVFHDVRRRGASSMAST
ncbi:hypothetical protein CMK12_10330 [Candidatus Poribacteria bacterium]|nr:hypothetical protein [Candidatus Poribacteria bacterium]